MINSLYSFILFLSVTGASVNTQAFVHYNKGIEYYKNNQADKAEAEFLKALESDDSNTLSRKMIGTLKREIYLNDVSDPFNDTVKEYYEKGLALYRLGEYEKANNIWEQALLISPANSQVRQFRDLVKQDEKIIIANELTREKIFVSGVKKEEIKRRKVQDKNLQDTKSKVEEKKVSDLYYEGLKAYKLGELLKAVNIWEQVLKLDPDLNKAKKYLERAKKQIKEGE